MNLDVSTSFEGNNNVCAATNTSNNNHNEHRAVRLQEHFDRYNSHTRRRRSRGPSTTTPVSLSDCHRFAETKLGKLLAKRGLTAESDFRVPCHASSENSCLTKSTQRTKKSTKSQSITKTTGNRKDEGETSLTRMLNRHRRQRKQQGPLGLSSVDTGTVSFSDTVLVQLLSKQGVQAERDFEVLYKGSKKHLYSTYLATPTKNPTTPRPTVPTYSTTATKVTDDQSPQNPKQNVCNHHQNQTAPSPSCLATVPNFGFHGERSLSFDGDDLFLTEIVDHKIPRVQKGQLLRNSMSTLSTATSLMSSSNSSFCYNRNDLAADTNESQQDIRYDEYIDVEKGGEDRDQSSRRTNVDPRGSWRDVLSDIVHHVFRNKSSNNNHKHVGASFSSSSPSLLSLDLSPLSLSDATMLAHYYSSEASLHHEKTVRFQNTK
eukprot:scaffold4825_cov153-Amphora_coffeaeformis.AAC.2